MSAPKTAECPGCKTILHHDGSLTGRTVRCPSCLTELTFPVDPLRHNDPEREMSDDSVRLKCAIYGQNPVQADGTVGECRFYFRAKHAAWHFIASTSADVDPSFLNEPHDLEAGFFKDGDTTGYLMQGEAPGASYMRFDEVETLLRECARRLLRAIAER